MKKLSALIIVFTLGTMLSFANNTNTEPKSPLTLEIQKMLAKPSFTLNSKDNKATVFLTMNNRREIVVIEVISDNIQVDSFVKGRLNYRKIENKNIERGKIYKLPLTIINN
jgi:hypothetical protein